jgi:prepilin-type N-terminal cleavage/methylation domain-containing protein
MTHRHRSSQDGFTLIELLVVIAIIAILAAILFPVFAQAREKARAVSCLSNTKQMGLGLTMYVQDYDESFPYWSWWYSSDAGNCGSRDTSALNAGCNHWESMWFNAIYPYVKNNQVFSCPSANDKSTLLQNAAWGWTNNNTATLMTNNGFNSALINSPNNYAYNQALAEGTLYGGSGGAATTLASLGLPAQILAIADCDTGETNSIPRPDPNNAADLNHTYIISRVAWPNATSNCYAGGNTACGAALNNDGYGIASQLPHPTSYYDSQARHTAGDNLTFADGHSKFVHASSITADYQFGTWTH